MKSIFKNIIFIAVFQTFYGGFVVAQSLSIQNLPQLKSAFESRVQNFSGRPVRALRVAILDKGFDQGLAILSHACAFPVEEVRDYSEAFLLRRGLPNLPAGNPPERSPHGTGMGLVFCELLQSRTDVKVEKLLLLNANGYTQLRRAIEFAVEQGVDVLLYPQTFDSLGNFDGGGLLRPLVDGYVATGGFWLNPVGNARDRVYNGVIERTRSYSDPLSLRLTSLLDQNPISIALSWDESWASDEGGLSEVDLDFEVVDSKGQVVAQSKKSQISIAAIGLRGAPERTEGSGFSREILTHTFGRGDYRIRVYWVGAKTIDMNSANLRVTLTGEKDSRAIDFVDASRRQEIMIPADHPKVLAVSDGSDDASRGPTLDGRKLRPEIFWPGSEVYFSSGEMKTGTSNASAMALAAAAVFRSVHPEKSASEFIEALRTGETSGNARETNYIQDPASGVLRRLVRSNTHPYFLPVFRNAVEPYRNYGPQNLRYFVKDRSSEAKVFPKGNPIQLSDEKPGEKSPWVELIF